MPGQNPACVCHTLRVLYCRLKTYALYLLDRTPLISSISWMMESVIQSVCQVTCNSTGVPSSKALGFLQQVSQRQFQAACYDHWNLSSDGNLRVHGLTRGTERHGALCASLTLCMCVVLGMLPTLTWRLWKIVQFEACYLNIIDKVYIQETGKVEVAIMGWSTKLNKQDLTVLFYLARGMNFYVVCLYIRFKNMQMTGNSEI